MTRKMIEAFFCDYHEDEHEATHTVSLRDLDHQGRAKGDPLFMDVCDEVWNWMCAVGRKPSASNRRTRTRTSPGPKRKRRGAGTGVFVGGAKARGLDPVAVREWAHAKRIKGVNALGKIPDHVLDAYEKEHSSV